VIGALIEIETMESTSFSFLISDIIAITVEIAPRIRPGIIKKIRPAIISPQLLLI
jgi:hypothetical protein